MNSRRVTILALTASALLLTACPLDVGGYETVEDRKQAVKNGTIVFPHAARAVRLANGCSGTMVNNNWVLTAAHCLGTKEPSAYSITFGAEARTPTHLKIHPRSNKIKGSGGGSDIDVAMFRIPTKFNGLPSATPLIFTGNTGVLYGLNAECYGYGAIDTYGSCNMSSDCNSGDFCKWGVCMVRHTGSLVRKATLKVKKDTVDEDAYFQLQVPNSLDQMMLPGDSGGACWMPGLAAIIGVTKSGNTTNYNRQNSGESFGSWASKRRDCQGFDANNPKTGFCSATCKCDVGEGDCDGNGQCREGLVCGTNNGAKHGFPSAYDMCVAPSSCPAFTTVAPNPRFCDNRACPCTVGEGDCDDDNDCGGSLVCRHNIGAAIGLPTAYDLCAYPTAPGCTPYNKDVTNWSLCTPGCPCGLGEGDCDTNADCRAGLRCAQNVGAKFGKTAGLDVCVQAYTITSVSPRKGLVRK